MLKLLEDHVKAGLNLLFVGFNPSLKSGETGHHYANPNNRFWSILYRAGLTERKLKPEEDAHVLEYHYGLTNIVERPTKGAEGISNDEYKKGAERLKRKIETLQPAIVCYVGKGVYQAFSGRRKVLWGEQETSMIPGTIDFVAPSSSGLVRMKLDEIVAIYQKLLPLLEGNKKH